ncbi:uncharacterized protein LOC121837751 [Ixodes scapularis]|uniref:uncharacterized protein LOC121837751 n=1 Tax=Ixodes scapularis TaxID=6945 RepID=UPI001C389F8D|nr:uncharacterized protein LOC121837751 [Ixodes scapularis]
MVEKGNTHVLVCIDHATRYVDASAVPSTASIDYINLLTKRWIPRFGVPEIIITDQARGFVNRNTKRIHRRLGVTHTTSPPYWPEANGLIERMVGTNNRLDWHIALQDAVTAVNVTRQSSTRYSPFWLMNGYDPKLPGELNIGSYDDGITETERLLNLARSRCAAKQNLENSQTLAKARYEADMKTPCFNVCDFVYCIKGSRCRSLDSLFEGPYEITEFKDSSTVLLKRAVPIEGRSNSRLANLQQLQRFVARDIEPVELSDSIIGQALANQVETEGSPEGVEEPAGSEHSGDELDAAAQNATSTAKGTKASSIPPRLYDKLN